MGYIRVLPRDLFNESDLLKCLGRLWIVTENGNHSAKFETEDCEVFDIQQNDDDGSIYVANVSFTVNGDECQIFRPLNSRRKWSVYCHTIDDDIQIFTESGDLTDEMRAFIGMKG